MVSAISSDYRSGYPTYPSVRAVDQRASATMEDERRAEDADDSGEAKKGGGATTADGDQLTEAQQQQIRKLQQRDTEVRTHEQAHKSAGGSLVGPASFSYQTGPDGRQYAIGGEVSIDMGEEREPEATIAKMTRVVVAALAPADPSPQDYSVASAAQQIAAQAEVDLARQRAEEGAPTGSQERSEGGMKTGTASSTAQQQRGLEGYAQAGAIQMGRATGTGVDLVA